MGAACRIMSPSYPKHRRACGGRVSMYESRLGCAPLQAVEKRDLLRCASSFVIAAYWLYASSLRICAPCISSFLNSLSEMPFFDGLLDWARRTLFPGTWVAFLPAAGGRCGCGSCEFRDAKNPFLTSDYVRKPEKSLGTVKPFECAIRLFSISGSVHGYMSRGSHRAIYGKITIRAVPIIRAAKSGSTPLKTFSNGMVLSIPLTT